MTLYIKKKCKNFIFQNDRNGEFAIGLCNLMRDAEQDHDGNYGQYVCPLGTKDCFIVKSFGLDSNYQKQIDNDYMAHMDIYCP